MSAAPLAVAAVAPAAATPTAAALVKARRQSSLQNQGGVHMDEIVETLVLKLKRR
jgi:hypothetical protein